MTENQAAQRITDDEVDRIVVAQAEDDAAWERPVPVRRPASSSVALPAELAARAAFFARLHRASSVQDWLRQIVEERIDLEQAEFASLKRDLAAGSAD